LLCFVKQIDIAWLVGVMFVIKQRAGMVMWVRLCLWYTLCFDRVRGGLSLHTNYPPIAKIYLCVRLYLILYAKVGGSMMFVDVPAVVCCYIAERVRRPRPADLSDYWFSQRTAHLVDAPSLPRKTTMHAMAPTTFCKIRC
jgi:hypothetical protein